MANEYTPAQYAFIETEVDAKLPGNLPTCLVLNFLGAGLCAWCESVEPLGRTGFCVACHAAFDSIIYTFD